MTDSRMKGRVKGLVGGTSSDNDKVEKTGVLPDPDAERKALQVLMLAQRTADEHIANAQQEADKIWTTARATAERIARDAQTHAEDTRREAGKALSDARAAAGQIIRDAEVHAERARREADKILSDARVHAEEMAEKAQANADGLEREAQMRYDHAVGALIAKRAALQEQIEALQQFDRDYRARLRTFMQGQLLALGGDKLTSNAEIEHSASTATTPPPPEQD